MEAGIEKLPVIQQKIIRAIQWKEKSVRSEYQTWRNIQEKCLSACQGAEIKKKQIVHGVRSEFERAGFGIREELFRRAVREGKAKDFQIQKLKDKNQEILVTLKEVLGQFCLLREVGEALTERAMFQCIGVRSQSEATERNEHLNCILASRTCDDGDSSQIAGQLMGGLASDEPLTAQQFTVNEQRSGIDAELENTGSLLPTIEITNEIPFEYASLSESSLSSAAKDEKQESKRREALLEEYAFHISELEKNKDGRQMRFEANIPGFHHIDCELRLNTSGEYSVQLYSPEVKVDVVRRSLALVQERLEQHGIKMKEIRFEELSTLA